MENTLKEKLRFYQNGLESKRESKTKEFGFAIF
jgi:hypothetical protein